MNRALRILAWCFVEMSFAAMPVLSAQQATPNPASIAPAADATPKEAQQLFRDGQFNDAFVLYEQIIATGKASAITYAEFTRVCLKLNMPGNALDAALNATRLDSSLAAGHSALGEAYLRLGKLVEARAEFLSLIQKGQADARAYLGLFRLYQAAYEFEKANDAIIAAHKLDPSDSDIQWAWLQTIPRPEQVQVLSSMVASSLKYFSDGEKDRLRRQLALTKDVIEHPERTCSLPAHPPANASFAFLSMEGTRFQISEKGSSERGFSEIAFPGHAVGVRVNGHDTALLVSMDNAGIVISSKIAKKLEVQPIADAEINDPDSQDPANGYYGATSFEDMYLGASPSNAVFIPKGYIGFVSSIKIGKIEFQNCYVTVVDRADKVNNFNQLDGILGLPILSSYLVELDVAYSKLRLNPLPPSPSSAERALMAVGSVTGSNPGFQNLNREPSSRSWQEIFHFGSRYLIPASVGQSRTGLFRISSFDTSAVGPELARQAGLVTSPGRNGGPFTTFIPSNFFYGPSDLSFGIFVVRQTQIPMYDPRKDSGDAGTEVAGILGVGSLTFTRSEDAETTIDFRDGLINFGCKTFATSECEKNDKSRLNTHVPSLGW
jgi:tetratricopeptide (TPR) repeat protein